MRNPLAVTTRLRGTAATGTRLAIAACTGTRLAIAACTGTRLAIAACTGTRLAIRGCVGTRSGMTVCTVAILAAVACAADGGAPGVVRTDSAGVEIVTSPGEDRAAPLVLEREWTTGGLTGLELTEVRPWHVGADAGGRVYVLDEAAKRVYVLNAAGEVEHTLGGPGRGPGELARPISLHVAADGTVGVWDYGNGGLVRWRGGAPLPVQRATAAFWGPDVRLLRGGAAFVARAQDGSTQRLVIADSGAVRDVAELTRIAERPAEFPTCGIRGIPVPPLFAPELNWDVAGERVIASASAAYELHVTSLDEPTGAVSAVWRRAVAPRAATEQLALREVGDGLPIPVANCTVPPAEVVRGRGYAEVVPAVRRLAADRTGRVWVLRGGVSDEPNLVDIFDASGAYIGTLTDAPIPAAFPGEDRLVGLEQVEPGIFAIGSWRIRRR